MKTNYPIKQIQIAEALGVSESYISAVLRGDKRLKWERAKQAGEFTNTDPILWADGEMDKIKQLLLKPDPTA